MSVIRTNMMPTVATRCDPPPELAPLRRMTVRQLQNRYAEVHGEPSRCNDKQFLIKRIVWRLQNAQDASLSERVARLRQKALAMARESDLRTIPPKSWLLPAVLPATSPGDTRRELPRERDPRLPAPGTVLSRPYRGRTYLVSVLEEGFEFEGVHYRSLSAVAAAICQSHVSGYRWFGIGVGRAVEGSAANGEPKAPTRS